MSKLCVAIENYKVPHEVFTPTKTLSKRKKICRYVKKYVKLKISSWKLFFLHFMQAESVFSCSVDTAFALGAFCTTWHESHSRDLASLFGTKEMVCQCGLNVPAVCLHHHSSRETAESVRLWGHFDHNCIFQFVSGCSLWYAKSWNTIIVSKRTGVERCGKRLAWTLRRAFFPKYKYQNHELFGNAEER